MGKKFMLQAIIFSALFLFSQVQNAFADVIVTITEPTDGSRISPCTDVKVKFQVEITAGEVISNVRVYANGLSKGIARSEPWEVNWSSAVTGNYILTAKATDADRNEYWSDSVKVKSGALSNGDLILNGGFQCGVMTNWAPNIQQGAVGTYTVMDDLYFDDQYYLYVEIENGGTENWHFQLSQQVPTDSGHTFEIYFLADADDRKTIGVGMQENQDPWSTQMWAEIEIDGLQEYGPLEFLATKNDPTNQLRFNFGGNDIDCYIDDVRVIDRSATSVKSSRLSFGEPASEFELYQAFPNPFNLTTNIQFRISRSSHVALDIFNMNGQKIKSLLNGLQTQGTHKIQWDGTDENSKVVPSGVYIYRMSAQSGNRTEELARKILLIK